MRQSRHFGITVKEAPKDAHTPAHGLLLRAGFVRPVSPGVHLTLAFFRRITDRLGRTARCEMEARAFEEIDLPLLASGGTAPAQGSVPRSPEGRGSAAGIGADGPQVLAAAAARDIRSYKDLPRRVFQVARRVGSDFAGRCAWLDGREFQALDAFGFDIDEAAAGRSIAAMRETCAALCRQAGLSLRVLEAEPGPDPCRRHALSVTAAGGDTEALACEACDYAALRPVAESRLEVFSQDAEMRPMEAVHGPGLIGVEPLAEFLGIPVWKTTKTLLFQADDRVVAVMVRGDCDVSEDKVRRHLGCRELALASAHVIRELTGADVGYAGGVGLPAGVCVLADGFTRERVNFECGANRTDYHNINVNWGRDLPLPEFGDFKAARPGDTCPRCGRGQVSALPAVTVGWLVIEVVPKGGPVYQDARGKPRSAALARCTLNLTRLTVRSAEAHHDEAGLKWPAGMAPFGVHLIGLNLEDEGVRSQAEALYSRLRAEGVEVLFDDRDARAGEKFSDSDLFGIPVRLTVSKRMIQEGKVELKCRGAAGSERVSQEDAIRAGCAVGAAQPGETS